MNRLPKTLRQTFRLHGKAADTLMSESTGTFIQTRGSANLKAAWARRIEIRDASLKKMADLRQAQSRHPANSTENRILQREIDTLSKRIDDINSFELGTVGNRRPDQIELFPGEQRALVTDVTLRPNDPWHNIKTMFYREVVAELTGWSRVTALEWRTSLQQTLIDDTFQLPQ